MDAMLDNTSGFIVDELCFFLLLNVFVVFRRRHIPYCELRSDSPK